MAVACYGAERHWVVLSLMVRIQNPYCVARQAARAYAEQCGVGFAHEVMRVLLAEPRVAISSRVAVSVAGAASRVEMM